jgi:SAM-dependent methyltransferase
MLRRLRFELRYLTGDAPWDSGVSPPELLEFLQEHQPGRAIDLGCGTGTNALAMADHGWHVVAVDRSFVAIMKARRRRAPSNASVRFVRCDVTRLASRVATTGPFDLALDLGCLHTLAAAQRPAYVADVQRRLAPGATYLLYTFLSREDDGESRRPSEAEILGLFARGFEPQRVEHGSFRERPSAWFTFRKASA